MHEVDEVGMSSCCNSPDEDDGVITEALVASDGVGTTPPYDIAAAAVVFAISWSMDRG